MCYNFFIEANCSPLQKRQRPSESVGWCLQVPLQCMQLIIAVPPR
jgi:hypothetical protein